MIEHLINTEFYNTPEGDVMIKINDQPVKMLSENETEVISALLCVIQDRYPSSFKRLSEIYTKSEKNKTLYEFKIVRRFIKCNFGEYDQYKSDIDHKGIFNFEEVRCPLRGDCRDECVICKPTLNNNISEREMEVFRLLYDNYEIQDIADELFISPATVIRHRENIKAKIKVNSTAKMIKYFSDNNLK